MDPTTNGDRHLERRALHALRRAARRRAPARRCCARATGIDTVITRRRLRRGRGRPRARPRAARASTATATAWSARSATTSTRASATARRASRASPTRGCAARAATRDYIRMATERSLERCGVERFDLLLLHNPDRIGYSQPGRVGGDAAVREAGLTRRLGVAPGPGQRLHARPDRLPRALRAS